MKRLLLIALTGALTLGAMPVQANTKLAKALISAGILTTLFAEGAHQMYKHGMFKDLWQFTKRKPWWTFGVGAATTGVALLYKDALAELFQPIASLMTRSAAQTVADTVTTTAV